MSIVIIMFRHVCGRYSSYTSNAKARQVLSLTSTSKINLPQRKQAIRKTDKFFTKQLAAFTDQLPQNNKPRIGTGPFKIG